LVLAAGVRHLDPASAVFEGMLGGWALQQQTRFLKPALMAQQTPSIPWLVRFALRIPVLRDIPPRMIALGIDRPHIESPAPKRR